MTGRLWDHLYSAQNARKRPTSTMALCLAKMDALLQAMWHCCKLLQTLCNLGIVSYRQNARYYRLLPYCTYSVDIDNQDKTPQSCWVRMINIPEPPYRAMWILQAMEVSRFFPTEIQISHTSHFPHAKDRFSPGMIDFWSSEFLWSYKRPSCHENWDQLLLQTCWIRWPTVGISLSLVDIR